MKGHKRAGRTTRTWLSIVTDTRQKVGASTATADWISTAAAKNLLKIGGRFTVTAACRQSHNRMKRFGAFCI